MERTSPLRRIVALPSATSTSFQPLEPISSPRPICWVTPLISNRAAELLPDSKMPTKVCFKTEFAALFASIATSVELGSTALEDCGWELGTDGEVDLGVGDWVGALSSFAGVLSSLGWDGLVLDLGIGLTWGLARNAAPAELWLGGKTGI